MKNVALIVMAMMAAVAVYAEDVDIGGKMYSFSNDQLGADYSYATGVCRGKGMELFGFETTEEWDAVLNYMESVGKVNYYWTNAINLEGSTTWQWGSSGVGFDNHDSRWAAQEPGPGPWTSEFVSIHVQDRQLYSDDSNLPNHVACEALA